MSRKTTLFPKQLLNSLGTAIMVVSPDNSIIYMNAAAESVMTLSSQKPHHDLLEHLTISETDEMPGKPVISYIDHARSSARNYAYRQAILHFPEGSSKTVDCCISNMEDDDNGNILIEMIITDRISQITRESLLFNQYSAAHQIAKGLAHEVNNPLSGIRGAAQLLEKSLSDPKQIECTQVIINETSRLQTLIKRIMGPNNLPEYCELNIHDILEHVKFLATNECKPNIKIQRDYDPSIPAIFADKDQLIQAVLNLVRNAIQALDRGGTITLRSRTARNITIHKTIYKLAVKLDIIDDGPGIPKHLQDQIFLPMIKGEPNKHKPEGSGLGLSIAQSLLNQNKGYISCSSESGHTVFSIYLPIGIAL